MYRVTNCPCCGEKVTHLDIDYTEEIKTEFEEGGHIIMERYFTCHKCGSNRTELLHGTIVNIEVVDEY